MYKAVFISGLMRVYSAEYSTPKLLQGLRKADIISLSGKRFEITSIAMNLETMTMYVYMMLLTKQEYKENYGKHQLNSKSCLVVS